MTDLIPVDSLACQVANSQTTSKLQSEWDSWLLVEFSTEGMDAVGYYLSNLNEGLIRFAEDPRYGSSVRCIKDTE